MPLTDDQLRALGRISVQSAELEFNTYMLVYLLVNPNMNIGRVAFDGESFAPMLRRVIRLSEEMERDNQELGARMRDWAKRAGDAQRRRNELLHATWVQDQRTGTMVPLGLTRLNIPTARTRVEELDKLADELTAVVQEANEIFYAIWPFGNVPQQQE